MLYRKFPISGKDVKKMTLHFHKQHITGISPNRMGGGTRRLISLKNTSRLYFQILVSARNKSSHYPMPLLHERTHPCKNTSHKHIIANGCSGNRRKETREISRAPWQLCLMAGEQVRHTNTPTYNKGVRKWWRGTFVRGKKEHALTIAVGRKMIPRGWKRGHSATNQTKKSLIAPKAWLSGSWKGRRCISQSGLRTSAVSKALKLLGPPDEAERGEVSKYFGLHAS